MVFCRFFLLVIISAVYSLFMSILIIVFKIIDKQSIIVWKTAIKENCFYIESSDKFGSKEKCADFDILKGTLATIYMKNLNLIFIVQSLMKVK